MLRLIGSVGFLGVLAMSATTVHAQVDPGFDPADWNFGPSNDVDGEVPIWNPVMQKLRNGEPVIGGTIRATDPRTYCSHGSGGIRFHMDGDAARGDELGAGFPNVAELSRPGGARCPDSSRG